ncbi:peptidase domain-containing ABC transporter [Rhodopila globiformis]|uniref:ABC transporter n=1 Tax=Rhodopila globiformis TaxID=1071 RepID=A0A2S6NAK3_RHOGL|nr:peptidase domain-containing ABC transporter [Rhodopila globiformis]PPQ31621.1 ABC transporter [Rhodopila globiformis]
MTHTLSLNPLGGARLPDIRQAEAAECGLACLAMVSGYHGRHVDLATLRRQHPISIRGVSLRSVMAIASEMGMTSRPLRLDMDDLTGLKTPAILHWDMDHFVVLRRASRRGVDIHDPALGMQHYSYAEAGKHFTGVALELAPADTFSRSNERMRLRLGEILIWPRGTRSSICQALILSVLLQVYAVASPFYMQLMVDDAIAKNDHDLMTVLAVGFGLFMLCNVGAGLLRSLALVHLQTGLALEMSAGVLRHLLRLPLDYFEKRRTGDLMSRFAATDPIRDLLTEGVMSAAVDGVMAVLMAVLIFIYSATLACIVIPALLAYVALRLATYRALRTRALTSLQAKARETGMFVETLRAIQTIKIFNRENERTGIWTNCRVEVLNADAAMARMRAGFRAGNELVFGIENVLVIYLGAAAVLNGGMSVGMLFAFMAYKTQFVDKAARFVEKAIEFRMLDVQLERLADIVGTEPEPELVRQAVPAAYRRPLQGAIEVRDLSFRYADDEAFIFENASFSVAAGEYIAITGPSGGGKTTLVKVMLGLLQPASGEILVDGTPLRQFGVRAFRDQVGVVMQDDQVMSGSVADNICCFDETFDLEWMQACAETAGIHDEIMRMPMAYNSLIGDMGTFLSGGQKQRILLARALYRRPRILFMDEGTSALDVALEARVNAAVKALGLTRIIIAHRRETIASASRVLTVRQGSIEERESPARFAQVPGHQPAPAHPAVIDSAG